MQVGSRTLVCNPESGTADHADYVADLARGRGFAVWETERAGDGRRLGREAATEGVTELAVCGGDGTVNEVLAGYHAVGDLSDLVLSVVPCGTANLLAGYIGVRGLEHGIEVADTGEKRTVDVGLSTAADGTERPFLVSCIAGLPADASVAASPELKARFGPLAFVVTGVQEVTTFDGLDAHLTATAADADHEWSGDALCVLVGNARRFVGEGGPGDMEDGLFDVAVVERMPPGDLVAEAVRNRVLGEHRDVDHFRASRVDVTTSDPVAFSLDGELDERTELHLSTLTDQLTLRVGPGYVPHPH